MTPSNQQDEPTRLDAHRAARAANDATSPDETTSDGDVETTKSPASFEESEIVRRARQIELLREVVDAGEYRPDPSKIAESMLENERS